VEDQECRLECVISGGTISYDENGEEAVAADGSYADSLVTLRLVDEEKGRDLSQSLDTELSGGADIWLV
jgi:hypothetical protein